MRPVVAFIFRALIFISTICYSNTSFALSPEAAVASCKESVGKPYVKACFDRLTAQGGARSQSFKQCMAAAVAPVRACATALWTKANSRPDVALSLPKAEKMPGSAGKVLSAGFVAPPRTISDIAAVLDSEKPDAAKIAERVSKAREEPSKNLDRQRLAEFYLSRGNARAELGQTSASIEDGERAIQFGVVSQENRTPLLARQFVGLQLLSIGELRKGIGSLEKLIEISGGSGHKAFLFNAYRLMVTAQIQSGDVGKAEVYAKKSEVLIKEARTHPHPAWRTNYAKYGRSWEADTLAARGFILEARGQYREAETELVKAEAYARAAVAEFEKAGSGPTTAQMIYGADSLLRSISRIKGAQGRLAEAEADSRRALLSELKNQGKFSPVTVYYVNELAGGLITQGRYQEAERLIRTSLDIQKTFGMADDSALRVQTLEQLAADLNLQSMSQSAAEVYRDIDKATATWDAVRKERLSLSSSRITSLYAAGQVEAGVSASKRQLVRAVDQMGNDSFSAAVARANLAVGYKFSGQFEDAAREFKLAIPVLIKATRETVLDDSGVNVDTSVDFLRGAVESYIEMVSRGSGSPNTEVASETFALADAIRARSVQDALGASSARASVKDPALAELVRKEQDSSKSIAAQQAALNNALASDTRDDNVIKATNAALANARKDLATTRGEINRRFPAYADLVNPKPPSIATVKANLKDGEALLSFYFGRQASFVWAVPKDGTPAFAAIDAKPGDLESKIRKIRESLEPNASMISEIPAFDVKLASELYATLLKPVESGWKESKSLIAVTNGALGLLPLSLLPTEVAEVDPNEKVLFQSYRNVKWLARTHAVTMIPSSSALLTLRQIPKAREGRGSLLAFGDPIFSAQQAEAEAQAKIEDEKIRIAEASISMRGLPLKRRNAPQLEGVDSAELAQLPRLPDTADELTSIAMALKADPAKSVLLGRNANEASVKQMDLSNYKVLAFATHGLVPGELNGLTQPALAMSAPAVAGSGEGDGLLTMEEILALKLDADWVVLSACNTGAGAGAGAEAASGLGRAFFYAGTRALLVTNWSVHSQSARELVTDLFKRQSDDPALTRGEALRRAMIAMIDEAGYKDESGDTQFVYAHPLFWAPYTIIGDTGGN